LANSPRRRTAKRAVQTSAPLADAPELVEHDEPEETNYALRLTEALEAISAAQPVALAEAAESVEVTYTAVRAPHTARPAAKPARLVVKVPAPVVDKLVIDELDAVLEKKPKRLAGWLAALDRLPPIRLPVGPPIPWRLGLPMLLALVAALFFFNRPIATSEPTGVRLPTQETYPVQQEAPLFANSHPEAPAAAAAPVANGPAPSGVDFFDLGLKFIAVLALAYGCLLLLKRFGLGGVSAGRSGGPTAVVRVVHSLVLAPNRSVHVLRIPGGKSLLVGATPTLVNLIADLGELDEDALVADGGSSFFEVLAGKLGR
jgi:flagellar biogenesis protein FliO